jgi:hypothetical protein
MCYRIFFNFSKFLSYYKSEERNQHTNIFLWQMKFEEHSMIQKNNYVLKKKPILFKGLLILIVIRRWWNKHTSIEKEKRKHTIDRKSEIVDYVSISEKDGQKQMPYSDICHREARHASQKEQHFNHNHLRVKHQLFSFYFLFFLSAQTFFCSLQKRSN